MTPEQLSGTVVTAMSVLSALRRHGDHFLKEKLGITRGAGLGIVQGNTQETSARRLNALARGMTSCSSYLEVGVAQGITLRRIRVPRRWGVDPVPQFDTDRVPRGVHFYAMPSDQFFRDESAPKDFDLVFLDGLHEWRQTYRDLLNALNHAQPGCLVLIDDVVPDDAMSAHPVHVEALRQKDEAGVTDGRWHGDVFKVLVAIRENHPELEFMLLEEPGSQNDNPQALLWRRDGVKINYDIADREAECPTYSQLSFDDVFGRTATHNFERFLEDEGVSRGLRAAGHG